MTMEFTVSGPEVVPALVEAACPDVYFTSGYGRAAAVAEAGTWRMGHWQDRILIPYVMRPIDGECVDAASPYGYAGIHMTSNCSPADLACFWSLALKRWRDMGMVSLFLRFSPLDPDALTVVQRLATVELTRRGDTIAVRVDQGAGQVWDGMQGRSRTAVRKAWATGMDATIRPAGPDDVAPGSPFRRRYEETMSRLGSAPGYFFPDAYYRELVDGLGKKLHIAEVRRPDGEVAAAALVLRHRDRAHYHLAGSEPESARQGANNLLVWTILEWAAESGCATVHLGGGVRADDGLFQFKRSFGGERTAFRTGTVIIDPGRYDLLVRRHAAATGRTTAEISRSGFFPAYRSR
ncbi:hypothetical protein Nm8I071_47650 [Nonomuraea sp. TT08I-71]|nr:hypothetical protein Nm8I071_47650 [Nonomuraea sp. TT08I-71]